MTQRRKMTKNKFIHINILIQQNYFNCRHKSDDKFWSSI